MSIKYKVEDIDISRIEKPKLIDDQQWWLLMVYQFFGFENFEQISDTARDFGDDWCNRFYWSGQIERKFVEKILSYYKDVRKRNQILKYYQDIAINYFPTNDLDIWERAHAT